MERLTQRTAKSWGGVPVRGTQGEWYPRCSSRWQEALGGVDQQVRVSYQEKHCVKWGQCKAHSKLWETEGQLLELVLERFSQSWFSSLVLAHISLSQRFLLMNHHLAPGSHTVVLLNLKKLYPFSVSVISLCFMSPLHLKKWETWEKKGVDTKQLTGALWVSELGKRRQDMRSSRQPPLHPGLRENISSSDRRKEQKNKREKKKGRKQKCEKQGKRKNRRKENGFLLS